METTRAPRAPDIWLGLAAVGVAAALLHPVTQAYVAGVWIAFMAAGALCALMWLRRLAAQRFRIVCRGRRWQVHPLALPRLPGRRPAKPARVLYEAKLLRTGFRAGSHLVLHFRNERGQCLSLLLWRGAVTPATFSRLRMALAGAETDDGPLFGHATLQRPALGTHSS